jgi:hypothetical protein
MPTPYTMLGGEVRYLDASEDFTIDASDGHLPLAEREIIGTIGLYLDEQDLIYEIRMRGMRVEVAIWEPSFEQRLRVAAHRIASLLTEEGMDVHDFKAIVHAALIGLEHDEQTSGEKADLLEQLDNIFHKLGGLE